MLLTIGGLAMVFACLALIGMVGVMHRLAVSELARLQSQVKE